MISQVYAQTQTPSAPPQGPQNPIVQFFGNPLFMLAVVFGIFYFLMIRPQRKKEQAHRKFLEGLKKGEEVLTQSGIYGRVAGVADKVVTLEVADKIRIKVSKNSVLGYSQAPGEAASS